MAIASITAPGLSRDTNVLASGTSYQRGVREQLGHAFAERRLEASVALTPHQHDGFGEPRESRRHIGQIGLGDVPQQGGQVAADAAVLTARFEPTLGELRVGIAQQQSEAERRMTQRRELASARTES